MSSPTQRNRAWGRGLPHIACELSSVVVVVLHFFAFRFEFFLRAFLGLQFPTGTVGPSALRHLLLEIRPLVAQLVKFSAGEVNQLLVGNV